jgi:hypothetical protein
LQELKAVADDGDAGSSGFRGAAAREGLDYDSALEAIEAMLWLKRRNDPDGDDERQTIADLRAEAADDAGNLLDGFLAGLRFARHETDT